MAKLILWDWDNTLVDSFEVIFAAQNDMRIYYGMSPWTKEESKKAMNFSGRNLIKELVGTEKAEEARSFYLKAYEKRAADLQLKPFAKEVLQLFQKEGYVNILASNKTAVVLKKEASRLGVLDLFDRLIGAGDALEDKPSKIFTDKAMEGLSPDFIFSIGDGVADLKMAANYTNGIGILVGTSPLLPEFEGMKVSHHVSNLKQLPLFLKGLNHEI